MSDRSGRQELHYRALEGDLSGIHRRPAAGDDVNLADRQGYTALHFAAQQSRTDAVKLLLGAGATVDPQDGFGNTPLWRAVFNSGGRADTVSALLAAGADPGILNAAGASPQDLAQRMAATEIIALFNKAH
jgi:ankyrin repeat protein